MISPWLYVAVAVILPQVLMIALLYAHGEREREARPEPRPTYSCDGCAATFEDERQAIEHARAEHRAPDDDTARQILTERAPE